MVQEGAAPAAGADADDMIIISDDEIQPGVTKATDTESTSDTQPHPPEHASTNGVPDRDTAEQGSVPQVDSGVETTQKPSPTHANGSTEAGAVGDGVADGAGNGTDKNATDKNVTDKSTDASQVPSTGSKKVKRKGMAAGDADALSSDEETEMEKWFKKLPDKHEVKTVRVELDMELARDFSLQDILDSEDERDREYNRHLAEEGALSESEIMEEPTTNWTDVIKKIESLAKETAVSDYESDGWIDDSEMVAEQITNNTRHGGFYVNVGHVDQETKDMVHGDVIKLPGSFLSGRGKGNGNAPSSTLPSKKKRKRASADPNKDPKAKKAKKSANGNSTMDKKDTSGTASAGKKKKLQPLKSKGSATSSALPKNGTASGTSTATATKKTKRPEIPAVAKYIPEKSKPVLLDKKGPTKKDPGAVSINSTHAPNRTSGAPSASTATATNPTTPQASRGNVVSTAPTTPAANRSRRKHVTRDEDALLEQRIYDTLSGPNKLLRDSIGFKEYNVDAVLRALSDGADCNKTLALIGDAAHILAAAPKASVNDACAILDVLCTNGLAVDTRNKDGDTVLHIALQMERIQLKLLRQFIDKGAPVNAVNARNRSALYLAGERLKAKTCSALIERGADKSLRDARGMTARDVVYNVSVVAGSNNEAAKKELLESLAIAVGAPPVKVGSSQIAPSHASPPVRVRNVDRSVDGRPQDLEKYKAQLRAFSDADVGRSTRLKVTISEDEVKILVKAVDLANRVLNKFQVSDFVNECAAILFTSKTTVYKRVKMHDIQQEAVEKLSALRRKINETNERVQGVKWNSEYQQLIINLVAGEQELLKYRKKNNVLVRELKSFLEETVCTQWSEGNMTLAFLLDKVPSLGVTYLQPGDDDRSESER